MPFLCREKNDLIFDFKLFRLRINTKKNYINANNKIILVNVMTGRETTVSSFPGLNIDFKGNNSVVKIYSGTRFANCKFTLRSNSFIEIKKSQYHIKNLHVSLSDECELAIGQDFSSESAAIFVDNEPCKKVSIGNDCMFSSQIRLRVSDVHRIYDVKTKEIINYGEDIVIGNHVWCGVGTTILKGTRIRDNSIIGACSLVNKKFEEENVIIAGTPAIVKKTGVNWDRKPPGSEVPIQEYIKEIV